MPKNFVDLFPIAASTIAGHIDKLYFFLVGISIFFSVLISVALVFLAIRYHKNSKVERKPLPFAPMFLEIGWTIVPLGIALVIFAWSAVLFIRIHKSPPDAMDVYVVGKRWMWKIQHPNGKREINELHMPINEPIRLTMTSQDVIHSFYIPAFRVKQDVLPGRYTQMWFEANRVGEYHLFCAEYCGTKHSGMIGKIIVMKPEDYEAWLGGGSGETMAQKGEKIFNRYACITCHQPDGRGRGPAVDKLFGTRVALQGGGSVVADEGYIRESILNPTKKLVAGYSSIMPTYANQLGEDEVLQLVAYLKSLKNGN